MVCIRTDAARSVAAQRAKPEYQRGEGVLEFGFEEGYRTWPMVQGIGLELRFDTVKKHGAAVNNTWRIWDNDDG